MQKAQLLVTLTFAAVFGAGVVTALVGHRLLATEPPERPHVGGGGGGPSSWIKTRLDLSDEQVKAFEQIMTTARDENIKRDRIRRENGQRLQENLIKRLTPEQKAEYDKDRTALEEANTKLREEVETVWKDADRKIHEILTPAQAEKWKQLRAERDRGGPRGEGQGGPRDGRGPRGEGGPRGNGPRGGEGPFGGPSSQPSFPPPPSGVPSGPPPPP